MDKTGKRVKC